MLVVDIIFSFHTILRKISIHSEAYILGWFEKQGDKQQNLLNWNDSIAMGHTKAPLVSQSLNKFSTHG